MSERRTAVETIRDGLELHWFERYGIIASFSASEEPADTTELFPPMDQIPTAVAVRVGDRVLTFRWSER